MVILNYLFHLKCIDMKKSLLNLLLVMLLGVCANQAQAQEQVFVSLDYNLTGVEYTGYQGHRTCTYYNVVNNQIDKYNYLHGLRSDDGRVDPNTECAFRIRNIDAPPTGKTWDDVVVTFNGGEPIDYVYTDIDKGTYCYFFNSGDNGGTLTIKWADTGAIEDVDADDKAIYYADGVVYNQVGEIAIYDVNGKLIVRTDAATVNVCDLANGVYIVHNGEKVVKFVK